ncbi:Holliday junction resolvase RuvX, partial [Mycoplasmopsis pullorum]
SVLIEAGMTRQKRKLHKDKLAAVLILEDFLNYYF